MANSTSLKPGDLWLWLATNEEQLLLHTGLMRLADHIPVPSGVAEVTGNDSGLPDMDGKKPSDLADIILRECGSKTTTYGSLMEYRRSSLCGYWNAVRAYEKERNITTPATNDPTSTNISSTSRTTNGGGGSTPGGSSTGFASRVSLVLILPIMKSLSRFDPGLSSEAASGLLECLRVYEPLSLSGEQLDSVHGLENLLHSWLAEKTINEKKEGEEEEEEGEKKAREMKQVQNAASALVALSVAVGTGSLLMRTVHLLQSLRTSYPHLTLLVPTILSKLLHEHLSHEDTVSLTPSAHCSCWNYDDATAVVVGGGGGGGGQEGGGRDVIGKRSIAFDGKFVFITNASITRLLKIGSGRHGTIRGYVYNSEVIDPGWVVWVNSRLIHKSFKSLENKDGENFCSELDPISLKARRTLLLSTPLPEGSQGLSLVSDGLFLYWLYHLGQRDGPSNPVTGEKIKQYPIFIQQLQINTAASMPDSLTLCVTGEPVLLQRGVLEREKNSEAMKALVRANPSSVAALSTIFGGNVKDDSSGITSVGMTRRILYNCSVYTTGNSVILIVPPTPPVGGRGGLFSPSNKALCMTLCFNMMTGMAVSQSDLNPSPNLYCALAKGASMNTMAASYDSINHCVWTANDDWIDEWDCTGRVRPAVHFLAARFNKSTTSDLIPAINKSAQSVEVSEAIKLLLRHIGIESCRLCPGAEPRGVVPHSLPLSFLVQSCDLLESSLTAGDMENCQSLILTLLAVLPVFLKRKKNKENDIGPHRDRVRTLVWRLLNTADCPQSLHTETRRLISFNAEELFLNTENCDQFVETLHRADSSQPNLLLLKSELLVQTASKLREATLLSPHILRLCPILTDGILTDSISIVTTCLETPPTLDQTTPTAPIVPIFSPSLQCSSALLNISLRMLTHAVSCKEKEEELEKKERENEKKGEDDSGKESGRRTAFEGLKAAQEILLLLCESFDLFTICQKTLEALCRGVEEQLNRAEVKEEKAEEGEVEEDEEKGDEEGGERERLLPLVEQALKSTVVGGLLLPLLVVVGDKRACTLSMANLLQRKLHPLVQLVAQLCGLLYSGSGKLSAIQIPSPWTTGRTVETIHPVRDNYKFKETVSFPGARNLYLKFDSRCSSQYDYDKVMVHAGNSQAGPKVAEFGGNTHGFGSRSVLGKGWPKDIIKVEGDTVTFTFDMKSGREHSTPDQAMWGFACTVRPQESSEDSSSSLPFPIDVYLSLASVSCSLIGRLYEGPPTTPEEQQCQHLTDSELLQQCEWQVSEESVDALPVDGDQTAISPPPPHSPLPPLVIERLRGLAKKPRPLLRPSTRELLQPDLLEDVIVSVCLKQHGLDSALQLLGQTSSSSSISSSSSGSGSSLVEEHSCLLDAIFTRINGLERRLQVLAELEKNWWTDVEDIVRGSLTPSDAFFFSLLQHDTSLQNFELLCYLKNVDTSQGDIFTTARLLQDCLELDVEKRRSVASDDSSQDHDHTPVTRQLVTGVMERARLLLSVTIAKGHTPSLNTYLSTDGESGSAEGEDGEGISSMLSYARSFSAPPITAEYAVRRQRSGVSLSRSRQALLEISTCIDKSNLLHQIFMFIGSKPEQAVSLECFLAAANQQWRRGVCRLRALRYLYQLLCSDHVTVLAMEHLLASVSSVIQRGPGVRDIACGGMAQQVREAFAGVMQAVVELASQQPTKCINTIAMLCVVPYTRMEETCLVRSGLVKLLDKLCSHASNSSPIEVGGEEDEEEHRVTALAWAAFQVLADRCVSWESPEVTVASSGLAQQVAMLLTNHLSRAMDSLVVSETGASEALQDALSLLLGLARSQMGRAILSQPTCVSKLLLLLTDTRPSPKLVLIALQLCRIALPLMTISDCAKVKVPPHPSLSSPSAGAGLAADIVQLLLAKLAEYIVPNSTQVQQRRTETRGKLSPVDTAEPHPFPPMLEKEVDETGQAAVYIYKRTSDNSTEILQPLIGQDSRQMRLMGPRMTEVVLIDRALSEHGRAEMFTDNYRSCQRRAIRWASMGFVVSVESPSTSSGEETAANVDKKKAKAEAAAKKKNLELLKRDPPRPFLSGQVAYSLASEVIGLLHGLLTVPGAAEVWSTAVREALLKSLSLIPELTPKLVQFSNHTHEAIATGSVPPSPGELLQTACLADATFAALGGFKESLRPGMVVKVVGEGVEDSCGVIQSIAERRGVASVQFSNDEFCFGPNKTLDVPLSRLLPPQKAMLPLDKLQVGPEFCTAVGAILKTTPPLINHAHSSTDANNASLGLCRLFAETRSRACSALLCNLQQSKEFLQSFMSSGYWQDLRDQLTIDPGLRLTVVETHCHSLRMLYRDCARPPAPFIERPRSEPKVITLDLTRDWPVVNFCAFSHNLTSVSYQGPSSSSSLPRPSTSGATSDQPPPPPQPKGVMLFANTPIPDYAPSFYWEVEMSHIGDTSTDAAQVSMGYTPYPEKPSDGRPWNYPLEAVFIRSSGRGCQVKGENQMEWATNRITPPLKSGDVVGFGWLREEEGDNGSVYFTHNGQKMESCFNSTPPEMIPFLHIQKKAVRVRVNFGDRPFAYGEGHAHRNAADVMKGDSAEEILAIFAELPFAYTSDEEEEEATDGEKKKEGGEGEEEEKDTGTIIDLTIAGPQIKIMKNPATSNVYDRLTSTTYQPNSSYDNMLECGPLVRPGGGAQEEESEEESTSTPQEEDLHALLVKAWESKVFPVIQRRFRNDQERKSGLEQIKGALQLGMEGIARETVEFLYEENGGIPKDLHLPTMDDVKADLGKFTISKVSKSMAVVVQKDLPYARCGVRAMQKTQGLTGIVLDIDEGNELVQVECYLQSEGALVRFWFPVVYLEKPPPGYRKSPTLRGADAANIMVYRELLKCEACLCSLYCRRSILALNLPPSPEIEPALDHLQLVAAESLCEPQMEGGTTSTCPDLSPSPETCLSQLSSSPLPLFYSQPARVLQQLSSLIHSRSMDLEGVASRLLDVLVTAPQQFTSTEVEITESRETLDLGDFSAAFLLLDCRNERDANPPPSATFKYPWTRGLCCKGGLGKNGQQQLQEVVRYPSQITNQYCGPTYPSLVLPFSHLHLKTGGCSVRPLKRLHVLSVPPSLPLSFAFIHSLCSHSLKSSSNSSHSSSSSITTARALSGVLEGLVKLLTQLTLPQIIKERTLALFSQVLWTLIHLAPPPSLSLSPLSTDLLQGLKQEVLDLYEKEISGFSNSKIKISFPPPGSISEGGSGKYSTYFQSLLEALLAAGAYSSRFNGTDPISQTPSTTSSSSSSSASSSSISSASSSESAVGSAGGHPAVTLKPVARGRFRCPPRGANKKDTAESEKKKKEEWLGVVHSAASILTSISSFPADGKEDLITASLPDQSHHHEASQLGSLPVNPCSRLILITDLPCNIPVNDIRDKLTRTCRPFGGLHDNQLYLPTIAVKEKRRENKSTGSSGLAAAQSTEELSGTDSVSVCIGHAVLELNCSNNTTPVCDAILNLSFRRKGDTGGGEVCGGEEEEKGKEKVTATVVNESLDFGSDQSTSTLLDEYLRVSLLGRPEGGERVGEEGELKLTLTARETLKTIFETSSEKKMVEERSTLTGQLLQFLTGYAGGKKEDAESLWREEIVVEDHKKEKAEGVRENQEKFGTEEFLRWCGEKAVEGPRRVWRGLFACGYDLHFNRCGFSSTDTLSHQTTLTQDQALVQYVDSLCRHFSVDSSSLEPWDIFPSQSSHSDNRLNPLRGFNLADLRLRFLQLKYINKQLSLLLPLVDLCSSDPLSLGCRVSRLAPLLFYDIKMSFLHAVLNASTRRSLDQAPPEIKMDPLQSLTGVAVLAVDTQFCKAAAQMITVPSPQLCVPLASGGDPTYAFNVKLAGEEVHGTSGSFRHFVWQAVRELRSSVLPILLPCPSGSTGLNSGRYILSPGQMTYSEEKLLQFFGQLLGVAIRADVPMALDLLPCFWKSLKRQTLLLADLREADCITHQLTEKMMKCSTVEEFDELLSSLVRSPSQGEVGVAGGGASYQHQMSVQQQGVQFVYHTMTGQEVELCENGHRRNLTFENREEFVEKVQGLRLRELSCDHRMTSVRCGLASVIPLQLLNLLTPADLDLRVCGIPEINLDYLRKHTKYHVGLEETDTHIQFFWNTLESFSQEELRKFIKFACNQERIPFGNPCRDGGREMDMNVPPYPMKIAPPDGSGPPDSRYIRAETCMFLLKLPQYSSQEIMSARLRYAIHCMEDPLSG